MRSGKEVPRIGLLGARERVWSESYLRVSRPRTSGFSKSGQ